MARCFKIRRLGSSVNYALFGYFDGLMYDAFHLQSLKHGDHGGWYSQIVTCDVAKKALDRAIPTFKKRYEKYPELIGDLEKIRKKMEEDDPRMMYQYEFF